MADQFIDEVVQSNAPAARAVHRAPVELVEGDNGRALPAAPPPGAAVTETDDVVSSGARVLPDSVKAKFAEIRAAQQAARAANGGGDEFADDDPDAPAGETPAEAAAAANGAPLDPTAPPAAPAQNAKPADPPPNDPNARWNAEIERRDTANRALLAELEAERAKPRESAEVKPLLDARAAYVEDELGAVRRFVAHSIGAADLNAPEVDQEMLALYTDLTNKTLNVTPSEAHQAKRDAARAKRIWSRENSERKAKELSTSDEATQTASTKKDADAAAFIGARLSEKSNDYPLLTNLAPLFDGMPAEQLLWKVVQRETKTGRIDPKLSDDQMIASAAKLVEDHYKGLIAKANQVTTPNQNPSTATPSGNPPPAATTSASPDRRPSPAARTLTNADASVAPATPPAIKPAPTEQKPKTFKNDDERKRWALRHLRPRRT